MKKIKYLAAVLILCASSAVSYLAGVYTDHKCHEKDYDAACRMSDLIRCYQDHLSDDSIIEDYGCFDELVGTFLEDDGVGEPVNLKDYVHCY